MTSAGQKLLWEEMRLEKVITSPWGRNSHLEPAQLAGATTTAMPPTSEGTAKMARKTLGAGREAWTRFSLENHPARTLISDVQPPD